MSEKEKFTLREALEMWIDMKEAEEKAKFLRREVENSILNSLPPGFTKGKDEYTVFALDLGDITLSITPRSKQEINTDKLHKIARDNGLENHIHDLFDFKPVINLKSWIAADKSITDPLRAAFTTEEKRPSFQIVWKGEKPNG